MNTATPLTISYAGQASRRVVLITLCRPQALNALNQSMCQTLLDQLPIWQDDTTIAAIVIRGAGHAFCAGGDIKQIYQYGQSQQDRAMAFFQIEYALNQAIQSCQLPWISLLDGVTMGGGAGISIHGGYRIATPAFCFAMPETQIGFYPDIGAASFLHACPQQWGRILGLTGLQIDAATALALGLVTQLMTAKACDEWLSTCLADPDSAIEHLATTQGDSQVQASPRRFSPEIHQAFSHTSVTEIITALRQINHPDAEALLSRLHSASPFSLQQTLKHLQKMRQANFTDIMQENHRLTSRFLDHPDFYEGIRAMVIDKDKSPQWQSTK